MKAAFLIFFLFVPAFAFAEVRGAEMLEFGIYEAEPDKSDGAGQEADSVKLIKETRNIPAAVGRNFGFVFVIKGLPEGEKVDIVKRVVFPEIMTDPASGRKFLDLKLNTSVITGERALIGYTFNNKWEMVPGEWTLQVFYGGRSIIEKTFYVFIPQ